ncbi:MAG: helicase-related protein, partial [Pseudohongiella sp.]|nr:helicase-related protein [Pseudohongiella sp.]
RTKHGANKLVMMLEKDGIQAAAIHGNKSQAQRTKVLHQFKNGELQVLVATDIAARGIDIDQLPHVINFDLPDVPEDYVHRIGRTARAGSEGQAISLVSADQTKQLKQIEKVLKTRLLLEVVPGFEQRERAQDEKEGLEAPRRAMAERQARSQSRGDNGRSSPRTSSTSARTSNGPARTSSTTTARTSTPRSTEPGQQRTPQRGNFDADKPFSRGPRRDSAATARPAQTRHVGIRPTPDSVDQERLYQSRGNQAAPAAADTRGERSDRRTPARNDNAPRKASPQRKDSSRVVSVW